MRSLASTGVLGKPEELFWVPEKTDSRPSVASALEQGTTANGVFGCKFQLEQWRDVLARERTAAPGLSDRELIVRAFPSPVFVRLERENRVAQAVSWSRALQTRQWRASDRATAEPVNDEWIRRFVEAESAGRKD